MVREFFKRRYIICEIVTTNGVGKLLVSDKEIEKSIEEGLQKSHGLVGVGQIIYRLKVKYLNPQTKICIVRVPRKAAKYVLESLKSIQKIGSVYGSLNIMAVSGTLRGCQKWLHTYHFKTLPKLIQEASMTGKIESMTLVKNLQSERESTEKKLSELESQKKF